MMRGFGFGQETGIELPGESSGLLRSADQWQGRDRYVTMFGQAYAITAMQEASAIATIANGGVRIAPHIVKSWTTRMERSRFPTRASRCRRWTQRRPRS